MNSNHVRKTTLYKGKRIDGLGYNFGKRFSHKNEIFISPPSKEPKSDTNRGYHHCDQVIPESVCRDTGVYDANRSVVCLYDILRNNDNNKEYFVYKVGWHTNLFISELTEDLKNFIEPTDILNIRTILDKSDKLVVGDMTNYTIVGHLYDYINIYRYINITLSKNSSFEDEFRYRYLAPGNFIMTKDNCIYLLQPSNNGLRLVDSSYNYIGLPIKELYSPSLKCPDNSDMDIMKVHVCTNHNDSIKLWSTFFRRNFIIDWNTTGGATPFSEQVEWDWCREYE